MSNIINEQIENLSEKYHFHVELVDRLCFFYGYSKAEEIIKALSVHPKTLAIRVNTLVTTTDELVQSLIEKDIPAKKHDIIEEAILIDIPGPHKIIEKPKKIIVHSTAATKVLLGGNLSAAGIKQHEDINIGDEVSIVDKNGTLVGNGISMMSSSELDIQKRAVAVKVTDSFYTLPNFQNLREYLRGQFIEQSLPSMLIGAQVDLKKDDRLLDMTVGEGKVLTHVWQRNSKINSRIIAIDKSSSKLQLLEENLKRLRMRSAPIEIMALDAKLIFKKFNRDETFDWILVEPPCTEIGLRPKVSDTTKERDVIQAANSHMKFMKQAARLIKPNGTIFYSTSSIDPEENDKVIQYAVDELRLSVVEQKIFLGDKGLNSFSGAQFLQYFYPDRHDTDGYFIAKLTK